MATKALLMGTVFEEPSGATLPVTTGLNLHLDASDGSSITKTGDLVDQWDDKSGAAITGNFTPFGAGGGTSTGQPEHGLVGQQVNGLDTVYFDQDSDAMAPTEFPDISLIGTGTGDLKGVDGYTIFYVIVPDEQFQAYYSTKYSKTITSSQIATGMVLSQSGDDIDGDTFNNLDEITAHAQLSSYHQPNPFDSAGPASHAGLQSGLGSFPQEFPGEAYISCVVCDDTVVGTGNTTLRGYINGTENQLQGNATGVSDDLPTGDYLPWMVGSGRDNGQQGGDLQARYWGAICEIIHYDRPLTDMERDQVHTYLADKWGIDKYVSPGNIVRDSSVPAMPSTKSLDLNNANSNNSVFSKEVGIANSWTIMMRFKVNTVHNPGPSGTQIFNIGSAAASSIRIQSDDFFGTDDLTVQIRDDSAPNTDFKFYRYTDMLDTAAEWHQIFVTWTGTTLSVYRAPVGGSVSFETPVIGSDDAVTQADINRSILFGSLSEAIDFRVHETAIWNSVLTTAEMDELIDGGAAEYAVDTNAGSYTSSADLQHWWLLGHVPSLAGADLAYPDFSGTSPPEPVNDDTYLTAHISVSQSDVVDDAP